MTDQPVHFARMLEEHSLLFLHVGYPLHVFIYSNKVENITSSLMIFFQRGTQDRVYEQLEEEGGVLKERAMTTHFHNNRERKLAISK